MAVLDEDSKLFLFSSGVATSSKGVNGERRIAQLFLLTLSKKPMHDEDIATKVRCATAQSDTYSQTQDLMHLNIPITPGHSSSIIMHMRTGRFWSHK